METNEKKIEEVLSRGVEEVIVKDDLQKKLESGKKLRIYFGIDPTGSRLHLGHSVVLHKLKEFTDLGHEVILLIGDFTAKIGDPSGRDATRVPLTDKQIRENFKDYKKQASKILNFSKVKLKYNSQWLSKLRLADILKLSSHVTVQQMMHREMFDKRIKDNSPISVSEFMYPLMQGYDSVAMNVDLEIAGNDQLFNMLVGRDLQKAYNNKDKNVLAMRLLLGTDGRKMSKTYNNAIYLDDEPSEMFGKVMSIKDELIDNYVELCTNLDLSEVKNIPNPRDQKAKLAFEIVKMYHGEKEAKMAEENFNKTFRDGGLPSEIEVFETNKEKYPILDLLFDSKLAESKSDAKRVVEGGGTEVDNLKVSDWKAEVGLKDGTIVKFGKRKFIKIKKV
ncbi:MAG: tyrosine--tRNA ligase [Candidatus Staskawiczbacteria bacterium]|nr:tyrosine--tRNA ligase [Candidatus Staskawiczbacteria bacterium]